MFALLLALTPLVASAARQADAFASRGDTTVVAFESVSLLPMDQDRVLDSQTVIVRGDRIA